MFPSKLVCPLLGVAILVDASPSLGQPQPKTPQTLDPQTVPEYSSDRTLPVGNSPVPSPPESADLLPPLLSDRSATQQRDRPMEPKPSLPVALPETVPIQSFARSPQSPAIKVEDKDSSVRATASPALQPPITPRSANLLPVLEIRGDPSLYQRPVPASPETIDSGSNFLAADRLGVPSSGVSTVSQSVSQPVSQPTIAPSPAAKESSSSPKQSSKESSKEDDALFEKIFGYPRTTNRNQQTIVPLLINDQQEGQILVLLKPGTIPAVRLQATSFLQKTVDILRSDIQEKLQAAIDKDGMLSLEVLRENGLDAVFDDRRLELQIQIPPDKRRINVYNLNQRGLPPEVKEAVQPAKFSGYINARLGDRFIWSGSPGTVTGRQPLSMALEGAINLNNWVIEGFGNFTEQAKPEWTRGDVRLVRDDPGNALRYVVGDLSIPTTGYQSAIPMVGITVARNFALQPYLVTRPISQFSFFLESPSRVEVFSNGQLVQTLQLPAGPQDIRNLPLNAGINNIQLVITDPVGRVQRLDFSTSVAGELLAPGVQQFAYSLGFPSRTDAGERIYDFSQPTATLSHRFGLTNTLTLGAYAQVNGDQQLYGLEGIWASSIGNFGWDVAYSNAPQGGDVAARLRYDFLQSGKHAPSFGASVEYRGANFIRFGELEPVNNTALDLTTYYRQRLFWDISGSLNFRYQFGRNTRDAYQISLGLSKTFKNGLGLNVVLSNTHNQDGTEEQRATINLSWSFPKARQSIRTSTEITDRTTTTNRLTWNYSSPNSIGGFTTSLGVGNTPNGYDLNGRVSYQGYRYQFDVSQSVAFPLDGTQSVTNTTQVNFGTALVFADHHLALTRPVNGSFAIIVPKAGARGRMIGVNPNATGGYTAKTDWLGAAVVPDLQAYQLSTLRIAAPNLPVGYDIGKTVYYALPTYKSGTVISVGTDATVFLRGVLLNSQGEPVALQIGEVRSLSDPTWQSLTLFTNKVGRFALPGFKPGRYEIQFYTTPPVVIPFEIPEGKSGIYDLGQVRSPTNINP